MNKDSQSASDVAKPSHEQISIRAQLLWTAEGRPEGRDEAIWLQAEKQLYDEAKEIIGSSGTTSIPSSSHSAPSSEDPVSPPSGGPQSSGAQTPAAPKKSPSAESEQMTGRNTGGAKSGTKRRSSGR